MSDKYKREGGYMLPRMTTGNWIFWAIIAWVGINFLWLALFEKFITQWVGFAIATTAAVWVFKYGPRPEDSEEEDE